MNQAAPLPLFPPMSKDDLKQVTRIVGERIALYKQPAFEFMFDFASGFNDLPERQKLAYYLQIDQQVGLVPFFTEPFALESGATDPEMGMPLPPVQFPSLMQLNPAQAAKMMLEAAHLFEKYGQRALQKAAEAVELQP